MSAIDVISVIVACVWAIVVVVVLIWIRNDIKRKNKEEKE